MAIIRYPAEFADSGSPETDYIKLQFLRRDYTSEKVEYLDEGNTIVLNMPQKITEGNTQNFANSQLGELGGLKVFGDRQGTVGNILGNALKRAGENYTLKTVNDLMNKLGASQLSENGILSAAAGIVFNPQLELLYEGPDFRRFNFQFSLFTKSSADAKAIKSIVDELRFQSLPSTGSYNAQGSKLGAALGGNIAAIAAGKAAGSVTEDVFKDALKGLTSGGSDFNFSNTLSSLVNGVIGTAALVTAGAATSGGTLFAGDGRFIQQPAFIYLQFMRGADRHPYIPSLMPASINQVNFDFTPTGNYTMLANYAEAKDKTLSTTIGVNITLQITEVTNLFKEGLDDKYQPKAPIIKKST